MHDYQKLQVWQRARDIAAQVYEVTGNFPRSERFGLADQMQRAAVSIAANLAEGAGRIGRKEFNRYVRIASGSACELETHVLIALAIPRLAPSIPQDLPDDLVVLKRMLHQFEKSLISDSPY